MGIWYDQARIGAARAAGRRYWRWLLLAHILHTSRRGLTILAATITAGVLAWLAFADHTAGLRHTLHLAAILRLTGGIGAVLTALTWLLRDLTTGAAVRGHLHGRRTGRTGLLACCLALIALSLLIH